MSNPVSLRYEELLLCLAEQNPNAFVHALATLQRRHPVLWEQASEAFNAEDAESMQGIPPKPDGEMEPMKWLERLQRVQGNDTCADCDADTPKWASRNLGVFLCTQCAGVHRKLGRHVSSVSSLLLDDWTMDEVRQMAEKGNVRVNARYEFHVPTGVCKPRPDAERAVRERYISDKYVRRLFCPRMPNAPPQEPLGGAVAAPLPPQSSPKSMRHAAMVEYVGYIAIRVICAKDLLNMTIGDKKEQGFSTQVCLTLGTQEVITKPCKGGVNPVFNEDLMLCWDGKEELQVDVYTRDGEHVGAGWADLEFLRPPLDGENNGMPQHPENPQGPQSPENPAEEDRKGEDGKMDHGEVPLDSDLELRRSAVDACGMVRREGDNHIVVNLHTRDTNRHRRASSGVATARANLRKLARGSLLFGSRNAQGSVFLELHFNPIDQ